MNIFERATRQKIRFASPAGALTVEDLWTLPLTSIAGKANLDQIAIGLNRQLKSTDDVSFVVKERKSDDTVQLAFDVVKHIIGVRLAESEEASKAKDKAEKKQILLGLLAEKQTDALKSLSAEELQKRIAEL